MNLDELTEGESPPNRNKTWLDRLDPKTRAACEQAKADYEQRDEIYKQKWTKLHIARLMVKKLDLPVSPHTVRAWL